MPQPSESRPRLSAARIVSIYAIASTLYILFSDRILLFMTDDPVWSAELQSVKGIGFVFVTAALLFWLIDRYSHSLKAVQQQEHDAANRLRAEQAKLQSILDSMGDGLVVVSKDAQLQQVNPTAAALLRISGDPPPAGEWPSRYRMYNDDKRTPLDPGDQPVMRALRGKVVERQGIYLAGDGPVKWLVMSARPIVGLGGAIEGAVAVLHDTTQSMQMNEALQESQRRLLTLLSNLPGMAYRCLNDRQWTMEFVSEGVEALTGYTWVELTSNQPAYADLIHPGDAEIVWNEVQRALRVREAFQLLYRITTRAGELRWVWEQGRGVFDDAEEVQALEGFICDVTEQKLAEDQLAESEARFRCLIENASDVITLLDNRGIILYQSPSVERVLGYGKDTLVGKRGLDYVLPDDHMRVRDMFRNALDHPEQAWPVDFRMRHASGAWRHVESFNQVFAMETPETIVVSNIRDVTERKETEAENRRLATAVEQTTEAVIICGPDGAMHYVNGAVLIMTQFARDDILGHSVHVLLASVGGEADEAHVAFEKALLDGAIWQGRLTARRKNGESFPCDVALSPIRDHARELLHGVVIIRDMTREARIEAQVRQQQKLEAIGTLAGGIAHDFNNILSAILGYTEIAILALSEDQPAVSKDLAQVIKAGQRARDLVRQILTFSRTTEVGRAPVKTDLILGEAFQLLRATLPSNIVLDTKIADDCDPVLLDPTHLHQVVMNLCINSYHAMEDGGGTLSIGSSQVTLDEDMAREYLDLKPGDYVRISVRDTGHGMDKAVMEHIFEPFFTTKGDQEGTGLGLSTAYGVIKEAGGAILVYSEKGRGTTMHVYIPAYKTEAAPEAPARTVVGRGRGECVLVVDDEPAIAIVVGKMLERLGYTSEPYIDSQKALQRFQENPGGYDVVLTDYSMPGVSGLQLAGEIRKTRPDIPILLTSGFHEAFNRRDIDSLPIDEVVAKPFDYQNLAAAIERVTQRPRRMDRTVVDLSANEDVPSKNP